MYKKDAERVFDWNFPRRDGPEVEMKIKTNPTNRWRVAYGEELVRMDMVRNRRISRAGSAL
jgi:hypothetical protein